jgi:hypothetical protein
VGELAEGSKQQTVNSKQQDQPVWDILLFTVCCLLFALF